MMPSPRILKNLVDSTPPLLGQQRKWGRFLPGTDPVQPDSNADSNLGGQQHLPANHGVQEPRSQIRRRTVEDSGGPAPANSKTAGRGFKSCRPCQFSCLNTALARAALQVQAD